MGDTEETVRREATPVGMSRIRGKDGVVRAGEDERAPWYVNMAFRFLLMIGLPTALLGWHEYKDYKYEGARLENDKNTITERAKTNLILERFEKVLWRVERKLPDEGK